MHEVHSFVSSCPGIEPGVADDLLKHLLESMPLHEEDGLRVNMLSDFLSVDCSPNSDSSSTWSPYSPQSGPASPRSPGSSALSPAPSSSSSTDDLCSDLEETDSEQSHLYTQEGEHQDVSILQYVSYSKSMWRPW